MTFKCRFNATCFLFKINRFVLIFSKTSNRFVLKICSGGFADYTLTFVSCVRANTSFCPPGLTITVTSAWFTSSSE